MPIYEFARPKCRVIFHFLSKRVNPNRPPACPKYGHKKMAKQVSGFATPRGLKEPSSGPQGEAPMPDLDDPKGMRARSELERDMEHLDENNPRRPARLMRKVNASCVCRSLSMLLWRARVQQPSPLGHLLRQRRPPGGAERTLARSGLISVPTKPPQPEIKPIQQPSL